MSVAVLAAPPGYAEFEAAGATVVARTDAERGLRRALQEAPTLYAWAEAQATATFHGRAPTYAAPLPESALEVVVRHAWHGGMLARVTKDRFRWPGRAPWELEASERLRAQGVPTPAVIAYVLYPAGRGLCRTDVATERLPAGADFPALWRTSDAAAREHLLAAIATLLRQLRAARAHHADLNVKNLFLAQQGLGFVAYALDVDRVQFDVPDAATANLARLSRSLRKARRQFGLALGEPEIARLMDLAQEAA